ncbi:glycosyltransferase, partial [Aeromonas sp. CPF2-S1]|nr:glycosyltransferase [Aeromonas sp. CPF2-S1]
ARWLAAGADESVASLSRRLWARTLFPEEVSDRLSELDGGDCLSSCWLSQVSVVD